MSPPPPDLQHDKESVLRTEAMAGVQQLVEHNFLVGIASLGAFHENRTKCGQELEIMLNAMAKHEVWGLKVLDSFGSAPKTFTWGNYFWFGTPDLCNDLNQPFTISLSHSRPPIFNATSPFPVQFIVVYLNFTTPYYIDIKLPYENLIHLGLCLPKSCSISKISSYTDFYFQHQYFQMQRNFKLKMKALDVKAPHFSWKYLTETGSVLIFMVLITTTLLGIFAEVVYNSKNKLKLQHTSHIKSHLNPNSPTNGVPTTNSIIDHEVPHRYELRQSSLCEELLMCFRFSLNYKTVMSLENSNTNSRFLTVMAGLRTIVCLWITVFHVYYYSLFAISNTPFIFARLEAFTLQPILQACFYVDIFFIMSSFLLVNNFLSNAKLLQQIRGLSWWGNLKLFIRSLLQRYMRLTPVMIITMLLSTMILDFLNMYSPFRLSENSGFYCKSNWWYNLLYIHNLLNMNDICCSWTWYLACEMQYFIIFTGLLFVHVKKPIAAKIVFVTLALGFVVIGWMCNFGSGITFEIDVIYSTLNQLYVKPWVRIPPYLGGATMGWLMHTMQQRQQQRQQQHQPQQQQKEQLLRTFGRKAFWLFCIVLYVTTNFMSYWRSTPTWVVATIMSMGKLLFALCIGGVIIMCACGRGGCLNVLLSARPFLFLNKFCFSIYMLAPVVVVAMFGLRNEPTNFTEVGSGADFFTVIVLSIMSAFLMLILIELPMQRIANRLLKQKNS
ncbi:nose resistant to fluoxetine protein 6-like [Calliphora vicina]|uniref:nose resistant to fluoxetine protein 6-like n=1 Tax=Calliphora vicina TaxID=7373 RepID=UPI00325BBE1A